MQESVADDRVPLCGNEMALALLPLWYSNTSYSQLDSLCPFPKRNPALTPGPQHGKLKGRVASGLILQQGISKLQQQQPWSPTV